MIFSSVAARCCWNSGTLLLIFMLAVSDDDVSQLAQPFREGDGNVYSAELKDKRLVGTALYVRARINK